MLPTSPAKHLAFLRKLKRQKTRSERPMTISSDSLTKLYFWLSKINGINIASE